MGRVRARTQAFAVRCLPGGWADLARQLLLFCGAYYAYRLVRGLVDGRAAQAFDNAREVIALEQALSLFVEPAVHAWVQGERWLLDATGWMYVNSHFTITTVTLAWIYLLRNSAFYYVRNMFMVAMGIALIAYAVFPTAPPRLMPEWGFTDPVAAITGVEPGSGISEVLINPFAAIPSMHVAFALMLGVPMSRMVRSRAAAGAAGFDLRASRPGVVVTRERWTRYWTVERGDACLRRAGEFTAIEVRSPGRVAVLARFSPARAIGRGRRCG